MIIDSPWEESAHIPHLHSHIQSNQLTHLLSPSLIITLFLPSTSSLMNLSTYDMLSLCFNGINYHLFNGLIM